MKSVNRCPFADCAALKEGYSRMQLAQAAAAAAKLPAAAVTSYNEYDLLTAVGSNVLRAEARRSGCQRLRVAHVSDGHLFARKHRSRPTPKPPALSRGFWCGGAYSSAIT